MLQCMGSQKVRRDLATEEQSNNWMVSVRLDTIWLKAVEGSKVVAVSWLLPWRQPLLLPSAHGPPVLIMSQRRKPGPTAALCDLTQVTSSILLLMTFYLQN